MKVRLLVAAATLFLVSVRTPLGGAFIFPAPAGLHAEQRWLQAGQEFVMGRGADGQIHCRSVSPAEAVALFGSSLAVDPGEPEPEAQTEIGNVTITFTGGFPAGAQTALLRAVEIVLQSISITVPIEIDARWEALEGNTLGRGGALLIIGPATPDKWSPEALISQIEGFPIFPGTPDIRLTMDSSEPDWYFGIDGNPPGNQIDFITVALHELIHGLGFGDSFTVDESNLGSYGLENSSGTTFPVRFDTFVQDGGGTQLTDTNTFPNPSQALGDALVGDAFFGGTEATAVNGGTAPRLFAPDPFQDGSSIAHWDNTFDGGPNALMTPSVAPGEANHSAGPLTDALLQDLGYEEGSQTIYFPVFANGLTLSSNMTGFNTSSTSALTATVRFFNQAGEEVDSSTFIPNAGSVAAQGLGTERELNPLGSFSLETSGQGDLVVGSAIITANGAIDGVLRFDLPGFGVAGVGSAEPLSAAIVPVRRNSSISTGVAIRNTSGVPITIEAELKDENGDVVANGTVTLPELPVDGQMQAFIEEEAFFPDADTSNFRGTLCLRSSDGKFAVVALEQGPGKFTTLPVSPIFGPSGPADEPSGPVGDLNGSWEGTTAQGKVLRFTVENDTITSLTFGGHFQGVGCTADSELTVNFSTGKAIANNRFEFTSNAGPGGISFTISGEFTSANMASGTLKMTLNAIPGVPSCSGTTNTTWEASKQ